MRTVVAMTNKAVPARRFTGPESRTGAWQAFFCHPCDALCDVSVKIIRHLGLFVGFYPRTQGLSDGAVR
jgi:hypothetical protein